MAEGNDMIKIESEDIDGAGEEKKVGNGDTLSNGHLGVYEHIYN